MFCSKCGFEIQNDNAAFCSQCGAKTEPQRQESDNQAIASPPPYGGQAQTPPLRPGSVIELGRYPQTLGFGGQFQGVAPIRWLILYYNPVANEALMISERIIDCKKYHIHKKGITWADSDIRRWLNIDFLNGAFTDGERERIIKTLCVGNGKDSGNDLPTTEDYVFLLNTVEARNMGADVHRQAAGTDYAKAVKPDRCSLYTYGWDDKANWWLRNRGVGGAGCVAFVQNGGSVYAHGHDANELHFGVRPVIRVRF